MFDVARGTSVGCSFSVASSEEEGYSIPILSARAATNSPPVSSTTSQRPPEWLVSKGRDSEKWAFAQLPIRATISSRISRILPASFSSIIQWVRIGTSNGRIVNLRRYFFVFRSLYFARLNAVFCSIPR